MRRSVLTKLSIGLSGFCCLAYVLALLIGYLHVLPDSISILIELPEGLAGAYFEGILSKALYTFSVLGLPLIYFNFLFMRQELRSTGSATIDSQTTVRKRGPRHDA